MKSDLTCDIARTAQYRHDNQMFTRQIDNDIFCDCCSRAPQMEMINELAPQNLPAFCRNRSIRIPP